VGQNTYEEVDLITRGGNYGWNIMEGKHCFPPPFTGCNTNGLILPIAEYDHGEGVSVTGGYVYRGSQINQLRGTYVFGDYGSGRIWGLKETSSNTWERTLLLDTDLNISSFGEDEAGEVYVIDLNGGVYRCDKHGPNGVCKSWRAPPCSGRVPTPVFAGEDTRATADAITIICSAHRVNQMAQRPFSDVTVPAARTADGMPSPARARRPLAVCGLQVLRSAWLGG